MKNIRDSIDSALDSVRFIQADRLAVLERIEGGHLVKRKLSVGLIAAIVLMLATLATALAVTLSKAYFEDVAKLQSKSGYYEDWSLSEKLYFLNLMIDYDVVTKDDELAAILDGSMTDADRERALDSFVAEKYGVNGRIDPVGLESILIKEKGELIFWSLEDKAWYNDLYESNGILGYDVCLMSMPGENAIPPEEATAIAKSAIMDAYQLTQEDLADYIPCLEYSIHRSLADKHDPFYIVSFVNSPEGYTPYNCAIANDGHVINLKDDPELGFWSPWEQAAYEAGQEAVRTESEQRLALLVEAHGPMGRWTPEVYHEWNPDSYLLPQENELTFQEAQTSARQHLNGMGSKFTDVYLDSLACGAYLSTGTYNNETGTWRHFYYLSYVNAKDEVVATVTLDAASGEIFSGEDCSDPSIPHGNG